MDATAACARYRRRRAGSVGRSRFVVEVAIARGYIPGAFVRNSVGDVLVIPLLYFVLRGVTRSTLSVALAASLVAGLAAELLQYLHLADLLGLKKGSLLYIVLGNTSSWSDLLMYGIGGALAAWFDVRVLQRRYASRNVPQERPP
jgi:hypothetical protein